MSFSFNTAQPVPSSPNTACFTHATPEKGKHRGDVHLSGVGDGGKLQVLRVPRLKKPALANMTRQQSP